MRKTGVTPAMIIMEENHVMTRNAYAKFGVSSASSGSNLNYKTDPRSKVNISLPVMSYDSDFDRKSGKMTRKSTNHALKLLTYVPTKRLEISMASV